jgi:hypothetical protein
MLITFLYGHDETPVLLPRFFCSNNLAFPRQPLLDLGGFDENFPLAAGEDREICDRWMALTELHFVDSAVVRHRQDLDLLSFCAQHYRYGRGAVHFWASHQARGHAGVRIASWRFYQKMLAFPFSQERPTRATRILLLLILSQAANAAGYIVERWKQRRAQRRVRYGKPEDSPVRPPYP